jgi:hypothetical protein
MSEFDLHITYGGGDADGHVMDMRLLALSMLGAERIVSDGLIILVHRRLPKRGERAPVILKAREPVEGSVELFMLLHAIFGTLDLGLPLAKELAADFIEEWWKAVIARFSGKNEIAELAITKMAEIDARRHVETMEINAQRHDEQMAMIALLRAGVSGEQRPAEQFVAPIGPSVTNATVLPARARPLLIGMDEADAIRDGAKLTWGPLEQLTLRTDGFKFHTSGLSVENPEREGFLMARVRDPRFEQDDNPYTEAAQSRAEIVVTGRRGYKDSTLAGIDIVDFIRDNPS